MINSNTETTPGTTDAPAKRAGRAVWLAGTAMLTMGMVAAASAQQSGSSQPAQSSQAQVQTQGQAQQQGGVADQLRAVEQSLRNAQQQISGSQQPNFAQARTAVQAGRDVLGRVPQQAQGQDALRTAQRELEEASQALQGQQPNQQQASMQIREAADAVASLVRGMGGSASAAQAGSAGTAAGSGAQINVQQQQPQINVQQPAPQVTVQQPPPQVTIQQPPPQVTVQQAQPQVTVQQAQPQVNVERQGQPQVTVQQQGQPQVNLQRQGQPQASGQQATATSQSAGIPVERLQNLIGTNVVGANGRDVGEVENLLVDSSGRVRAAVLEWGGFLGLGEREALVPIERIRLGTNQNEKAQLTMTREELEALPRYDRSKIADYGREHGWGEGVRLHR